jgi:hypothetical protein
VRSKAASLDTDSRFEYALRVSSEIHELRHWHDYVGTTWGYERLVRTLQDGGHFNQMWKSLDRAVPVQLPLTAWDDDPRAPAALRDYLQSRQKFVGWVSLQQGTVPSVPWSPSSPAEVILSYSVGGLQANIPTVEMNFDVDDGTQIRRMMPLGAHALMEGNALVVQRHLLDELFGAGTGLELMDSFRRGLIDDDSWIRYLVVDRFLTRRFVKFWTQFQTALTDLAFMASPDIVPARRHPGIRLDLSASAAASLGAQFHQDSDPDIAKYQSSIAAKCGWKDPADVVAARISEIRGHLKALEVKMSAPGYVRGLWDVLMRAIHRAHLACLEVRRDQPWVFAHPAIYVLTIPALPPPPVTIEGKVMQFRGVGPGRTGDEHAVAFRNWFLFEHVQRRLLFSTSLPCPGIEPHDCPGDPLTPGWAPRQTCPYSKLVSDLGIPHMTFKTIAQQGR